MAAVERRRATSRRYFAACLRLVVAFAVATVSTNAAAAAVPALAQTIVDPAIPASDAGLQPVSDPTVTGPIPSRAIGSAGHDYPFGAAFIDLAEVGYIEEEFFFSGTAAGQPYTSRMLVRRPLRAAGFSGTVVSEWTNVSNGYGFDCLWARSANQIIRDGDAYVVIDAQTQGVHQTGTGLKAFSPRRYESLAIPQSGTFVAEAGAYEIFAQALMAIRDPSSVPPLGGLEVRHQVVTGCSQSAGAISIYATSAGATQGLADGYLITELSTDSIDPASPGVVFPVLTPELVGVPVLQLNTENDEGAVRLQPDSDGYRLWEVAGATHVDITAQSYAERIARRDLEILPQPLGCELPPLSRIPFAHVQNAALVAIKRWIAKGDVPPVFPQIRSAGGEVVRDSDGNALGGIRLPEHAVPTATNSRINSGNDVCARLAGSHIPFTRSRLESLYPSRQAYLSRFARATHRAVLAEFLLPHDARLSLRQAHARHLRPGGTTR